MKVVQVFNNNVVLAVTKTGDEVILTGWGIGFGQKPGREVDKTKIVRTFVPEKDRDPDELAAQLASIDPAYLSTVADALQAETASTNITYGSATVLALADHIHTARLRFDKDPTDHSHPLTAEVVNLYPEEYAMAIRLLQAINTRLALNLPDSEATAIALHLVNANFMTGDLTETYLMTGVFQQLFDIISVSFDIKIDPKSLSAARFITHLRYFFVRARKNQQLNEGLKVLQASLETSHPEALECATRLAAVLELRLGTAINEDEVAYLALHVARLATEAIDS